METTYVYSDIKNLKIYSFHEHANMTHAPHLVDYGAHLLMSLHSLPNVTNLQINSLVTPFLYQPATWTMSTSMIY